MIEGVLEVPLRQFEDERGTLFHMLRCDAPHFTRFGEIYFSETRPGVVKAWKRHREMTQHFAVPVGELRLVICDDRPASSTRGRVVVFDLGRDRYRLVRVPNGLWYGFTCTGDHSALLANCADLPHNPDESESIPADSPQIPYRW
jgi:dTDP-4-dehydrorhamnose 3,5-epimerase